jgi:competence protein ComEC
MHGGTNDTPERELTRKIRKHRNEVLVFVLALVALDVVVWSQIAVHVRDRGLLRTYFLDVGQGDSELVVLPGGVRMLVDGGPPNGRVLAALASVLSPTDRYIDLVVLSHPQTDHFGGLIEVARRYRIGAFISTGISNAVPGYEDLIRTLDERGVRRISLAAGDVIWYGGSRVDVLSPTREFLTATDVNETTLVLRVVGNGVAALFTGDADAEVERMLAAVAGSIDVLKVSHHGSKFSSTQEFLDATRPVLAVIEVGKNSYGHPTPQALGRLADSGTRIFRTDLNGTIEVVADGIGIRVFAK